MKAWALKYDKAVSYQRGLHIQRLLLSARQSDSIPDTVLLMQHTPTVTLGNRGRDNYLLRSREEYREMGVDLFTVERGGDVTYHGPGQWVVYPILRLGSERADSHGYLHNLEEISIRTARAFGVDAFRREGMNGAWTRAGKLAAIGFRLKRWVSFHGMSFNVNLDLTGFETIVPCGLTGQKVASLETILGADCPSLEDVGSVLLENFSTVCGRDLEVFDSPDKLPPVLRALDEKLLSP